MRIISGKVEGDATIHDAVLLQGIIVGDIVVVSGGRLDLLGMCCGNLRIEKNGLVNMRGTVGKHVTNDGGNLDVHGTIHGQLFEIDGHTIVRTGAIVGGVQR